MSVVKAINTRAKSSAALSNTLDYIYKDKKVTEELKLVTGDYFEEKVTADLVYQQFKETKKFWNKTGGRQYKHFVISFHPDEKITPEETLLVGKEWAERCFPGFTCALASHIDSDHCHCHVVVNSVNSIDGSKVHLSKADFKQMKKINDEICEAHGLSVCVKGKHFDGSDIEEGTIHSYDKRDYRLMTTDGKKSLKTDCISAVLACMTTATSKEEFISQMEEHGYEVKWEDNRKYITFTHIESGKSFRDKNLAETYSIELSKEVLEDAFNRNRTVQKERSDITDEGDRKRKVLEEPVREATEKYANPDADHRTSAEKNSTVGGKPGNGTFREWPVERLDRRVDETAKRTRGIVDWGKKLRETFSHCLEQLRSFGFGSGLKSNTLESEADRVAEHIEEIRARIAAIDHTLRTQYLPSQGKDSWIDEQITLEYQEEYRLLDDLSELLKSTPPMILALAQSKRNTFRPEKEVDMLRALTSNEFELTKEEVADSFTTALATADKMLSNVPSTMKSLEESHGCQPIEHNIVRRGRRR